MKKRRPRTCSRKQREINGGVARGDLDLTQPWLVTSEPLSRAALCDCLDTMYGAGTCVLLPGELAIDDLVRFLEMPSIGDKIVVADLTRHLIVMVRLLQFTNLCRRCFYVRPHLMQFPEGLASLAFPFDEESIDTRRMLVLCDSLLCDEAKAAHVELETLVFSPGVATEILADWLKRECVPSTFQVNLNSLGSAYAAIQHLCRR